MVSASYSMASKRVGVDNYVLPLENHSLLNLVCVLDRFFSLSVVNFKYFFMTLPRACHSPLSRILSGLLVPPKRIEPDTPKSARSDPNLAFKAHLNSNICHCKVFLLCCPHRIPINTPLFGIGGVSSF